jgi:4-hydroxy-3-polyprenylbenzoate decarboxylase
LQHLLRRVDWQRDLHFQTCTTIDTLDYSGGQLNAGSKLVIAAVGPARRELGVEFRGELPAGFREPRVCLPGVLAVSGPRFVPGDATDANPDLRTFAASYSAGDPINQFPWIVLVDDSEFTARTLANFLWVCFTRSDPARDLDGIKAFTVHKHWGCRGSIVIDARIKPHHAAVLEEDPQISNRVDALAARGGPLSKWL